MITIDKAIELLSDSANRGVTTFNQNYKDAQNLGIEALKRLEHIRRSQAFVSPYSLLPGETKD